MSETVTAKTGKHINVAASDEWGPLPTNSILEVMERFGTGAVICDPTETGFPIVQSSPKFSTITDYKSEEIKGRSISILQGSERRSPLLTAISKAVAKDVSAMGELLFYQKDGTPFWGEWVLIPRSKGGKPALVAIGIRNISARRERQDKLKDDYAAWRGMFDNAVEGIYRSTVDGHYLEVNPALAKMYGYESAEQLLTGVSDISNQIYVDPSFRERFKTEIAEHGEVKGLEYQVRRRDGGIIWISESARLVRDSKGAVRYYEGFIEDITDRKTAELKLQESQQKLLETSRQVGMAEMATSILHNMGNALNSVNTSVFVAAERVKKSKIGNVGRVAEMIKAHLADIGDYLTHDPKGKKVPEFLEQLAAHLTKEQSAILEEFETLKKSLEHVNEIIAMQQNYAKAAGMTETVSMVNLLEDAVRMNATSLARHGVELVREYEPLLPEVTVAKHKVLQILMNLIRNAQKACDDLNRERSIRLHATTLKDRNWVRVEVIDNGVGIPPENLTRIFTHGFTTRKDGHGFGLHSGALMAKELGGSLLARSEGPGKGAVFTLEFPCKAPEKAELEKPVKKRAR